MTDARIVSSLVPEPATPLVAEWRTIGDPASAGRIASAPQCGRKLIVSAVALFLTSFLLFLGFIGRSHSYVYDELCYVSSARALLQHAPNPNFEHPPVGKYFIALGILAVGDNVYGWRISSAAAGSLSVIAVFLLTYFLLRDRSAAMIAALLTIFNNFLFVMSRVAMLDIFLVSLLLWALVLFSVVACADIGRRARTTGLLFCGVLFGLACACKWNAVFSLAAIAAVVFVLWILGRRQWVFRDELLTTSAHNIASVSLPALVLGMVLIPAFTYVISYLPLFHSLGTPFTFAGMVRMHQQMFHFMATRQGNSFLHNPWYHWPIQSTPQRALSYLVGNLVVMWIGLLALIACLLRMVRRLALPELTIVLLYAANLLQWVVIPRKHTYYYYYFPAAMLLSVTIAIALARLQHKRVFGIRVSLLLVSAAAAFFLFCYPRMASLESPWDCMLGCWS